jgi:hypothetical protein
MSDTCVTKPAANAEGASRDKIDTLCEHIMAHLRATTGRFETVNKLTIALRADIPSPKATLRQHCNDSRTED